MENERSRPDLHRRSPLAHVRVAEDNVKTAITTGIGVRLVARVHDRPTIHRVDADEHAEEIGALRNLIDARLTGGALGFDAHFAGAGKNLPCNQKWKNAGDNSIPWNVAAHQIIVVATVAVTEEVGVVLVKANFLAGFEFLVPPTRAFREDAFARF